MLVIGAIAALIGMTAGLRQYDDYDVRQSIDLTAVSGSSFLDFQGKLISYSRDGVSCMDYDGNLIWTETFEMDDPQLKKCENYLLIYDRGGTAIEILNLSGEKGRISTARPITSADISGTGDVACLMRENDTHHLELYDTSGEILADGELHTENAGYPIAIALSSDAKKLMVSMISLNNGDVKTTIRFYQFGRAGQKQKNNIVASFSYANMIIPEVDFVKGDRALAVGDTEIIVYSSASVPKSVSEIYPEGEMKCVFFDDSYFGYILNDSSDTDGSGQTLEVYSVYGHRRCRRAIDAVYRTVSMTSNHEILLTDGENVTLYTISGIRKFAYDFKEGIYQLIPYDGKRDFVLLLPGKLEKIRIK